MDLKRLSIAPGRDGLWRSRLRACGGYVHSYEEISILLRAFYKQTDHLSRYIFLSTESSPPRRTSRSRPTYQRPAPPRHALPAVPRLCLAADGSKASRLSGVPSINWFIGFAPRCTSDCSLVVLHIFYGPSISE